MIEKYLIPLRILSESNVSEHWTKKAKRHKLQKRIVKLFLRDCKVKPPCTIMLTRIAPRNLDEHDNLPASFKWILDCVCDILIPGLQTGRADGDKGIKKIEYFQRKGKPKEYYIEIEIAGV